MRATHEKSISAIENHKQNASPAERVCRKNYRPSPDLGHRADLLIKVFFEAFIPLASRISELTERRSQWGSGNSGKDCSQAVQPDWQPVLQ
jgi:hypothetical protein